MSPFHFGIKGYKLYDVNTNEVFESSNVIFHEHLFPFQQDSCTQVDPYLVFPKVRFDNSYALDTIGTIPLTYYILC